MGWSQPFMGAISGRQCTPIWVIETVATPYGPSGGTVIASSDRRYGAPLLQTPPTISPSSVTPVSWSYSGASWSFRVVGSIRNLIDQGLRRGTVLRARLGFMGWDLEDFEPVALGMVHQVGGAPGQGYQVTCWDLLPALRGRLSSTIGELSLFYGIDSGDTTLTVAYTVGDATLDVTSATGLLRETGGSGAVRVTPAGGTPFYLTYTGKAANQLTGVSATGKFGTTAANAAIGDVVEAIAYLSGHPFDIARKLLCSTGAGTNGAFDVYPASWGMLLPDDCWDHDDTNDWREVVAKVSAGALSFDVVVDSMIEDAGAWIASLLQLDAMWITVRQGRLVCRCAQVPPDAAKVASYDVSSADVVSVDDWQGWAAEAPIEYSRLRITTGLAGATDYDSGQIRSWPAKRRVDYDLSQVVFGNEAAIKAELYARIYGWCFTPPEAFSIRCPSFKLSSLCPGDIVGVTIPTLDGRCSNSGGGYLGQRSMVQELSPGWSRGGTGIRFLTFEG